VVFESLFARKLKPLIIIHSKLNLKTGIFGQVKQKEDVRNCWLLEDETVKKPFDMSESFASCGSVFSNCPVYW